MFEECSSKTIYKKNFALTNNHARNFVYDRGVKNVFLGVVIWKSRAAKRSKFLPIIGKLKHILLGVVNWNTDQGYQKLGIGD